MFAQEGGATDRSAKTVLLAAASLALFVAATPASAAVPLKRISTDPFTNSTSQHRTQVEPDTYSFGSTIVSAFQSGRFFDGGSSGIGWATSNNGGVNWQNGFLPGLTRFTGGSFDRASDPSVAFDARHNAWLISSLVIRGNSPVGVVTSRSTDGGHTWAAPVTVTSGSSDKNWIACDNNAASPFYGNCYSEWDRPSSGDLLLMSTSTNGGLSWGPARATADGARGLGGQPVVQPNGTVIVPAANPSFSSILAFRSVDGGATWRRSVQVAPVSDHPVAGGLRSEPLPSAEVDAAGRVFVVWQDCRFRTTCRSNDLVMSTTTQAGYPTWSSVTRIPIDATTSTVDHFIPGLAVDRGTSGSTARLALAYYYYPNTACSLTTCQLNVGYLSSRNGGFTWSTPTQLAGPMSLTWLPSTSGGRMVGDYISTSFSNGSAHPMFAVASAPVGGLFDEAMFTPVSGLP